MIQPFFSFLLLIISISIAPTVMSQDSFKIIGHRGAMGYELENSRASFKKAISMNVDMIELDVFRCASGEIVVFHDDNLKRLTNSLANIEALTYQDLQKVLLTNGETIPSLGEVLDLIDGQVQLNIELKGKNTAKGTLELIQKAIEKGNWKDSDFIISSFDWQELATMRLIDSTIAIAVLTEHSAIEAITTAKELKALAINPWYKNLSKKDVETIHAAGFKIFAYTVNEPRSIRKMKKFNIEGIFTNFPDIAKEI